MRKIKSMVLAVGVGLGCLSLYYVIIFVIGFVRSTNYQPEIMQQYESVEYVQHHVAFGVILSKQIPVVEIGMVLLGMGGYFMVRRLRAMSRRRIPNETC